MSESNNIKEFIDSNIESYLQGYKDALEVVKVAIQIETPTKEKMLDSFRKKMAEMSK